MIEKVQASREGDSEIDWRIALMEVQDLVLAAKNTTPGINDLASLGEWALLILLMIITYATSYACMSYFSICYCTNLHNFIAPVS